MSSVYLSVCRLSFVCNASIVAKRYVVIREGVDYMILLLDRAMTCSYRQSIAAMALSSGLFASLNAKFRPASITHVRQITVSYSSVDCNVRYTSVTLACMELQSV